MFLELMTLERSKRSRRLGAKKETKLNETSTIERETSRFETRDEK